MARPLDLVGQRFGRLVVASRAASDARGEARWSCRCDCGGTKTTRGSLLRSGNATSCGCAQLESAKRSGASRRQHGHSFPRSPTYRTWRAMLGRCESPGTNSFDQYGGAGVTVCQQWHDFEVFLKDMGERPAGKTLDRIDNSKGYEPANCRWATPKEQAANRSNHKTRKVA